ncbi:MAG: hypothetical protein WCY29_13960 [Novosphingobium sp.]
MVPASRLARLLGSNPAIQDKGVGEWGRCFIPAAQYKSGGYLPQPLFDMNAQTCMENFHR